MTEISGQATDIKIHADEILKLKRKLNEILAKEAKQSITQVERDTERDFFMSALEAKKYGIIDSVVEATKASFLRQPAGNRFSLRQKAKKIVR